MSHASLDLTGISLLAVIALGCGLLLMRLRQPPIVGYILAGVILGPSGLGLVDNNSGVRTFAELGVLFLLFIIGMEVSLRAFRQVLVTVLACAALQAAIAVAITFLLSPLAGWSTGNVLVFGFVVALSSTAVGIKLLEEIGELRTDVGRLTIGVLVAQDLLVVPMLIITNAAGGSDMAGPGLWIRLALGLGGLVFLVGYLSRAPRLRLPFTAILRKRGDLGPLAAFSFCLVLATISGLVGLTASYGAFIAGLVIGATAERSLVLRASLPIQSILLMVFFLSIGLLIDLEFLWHNLAVILFALAAMIVLKTLINTAILRLLGVDLERAFLSGIIMAQLGEFSFIVAAAGLSTGAIDTPQYQIALTVIALSLIISPIWLVTLRRLQYIGQTHYAKFGALVTDVYRDEFRALRRAGAFTARMLEHAQSLARRKKATPAPRALPPPPDDTLTTL